MLFATPDLNDREMQVVDEVEELRRRLRHQLFEPRRWSGSLRRLSFARAIQASNSIEGFNASLDDVAATAVGEEPLDADTETRLALSGYRQAMTYVLQLANEESFEYSEQLIKSLHFMMVNHDLDSRPGLWRSGAIYVHGGETGEIVYEGPDVDRVPDLMAELVDSLHGQDHPGMIRAGIAHLNLVMVHPFRDGNGRMARCLQTLVLARDRILAPQFCSIEEYLGRNTQSYYDVLAEVGGGSWNPNRDARPWIRYILTAHLRQAHTLLLRVRESERLWVELEQFIGKLGLQERVIPALFDAAIGLRVRRATYRAILEDHEISEQAAGRDLRQLAERGVLIPHGEKRGRYYTASHQLSDLWSKIRATREARDQSDPFAA